MGAWGLSIIGTVSSTSNIFVGDAIDVADALDWYFTDLSSGRR